MHQVSNSEPQRHSSGLLTLKIQRKDEKISCKNIMNPSECGSKSAGGGVHSRKLFLYRTLEFPLQNDTLIQKKNGKKYTPERKNTLHNIELSVNSSKRSLLTSGLHVKKCLFLYPVLEKRGASIPGKECTSRQQNILSTLLPLRDQNQQISTRFCWKIRIQKQR